MTACTTLNRALTAAYLAAGLNLVLVQSRCRRDGWAWRRCERALRWVNERGERL